MLKVGQLIDDITIEGKESRRWRCRCKCGTPFYLQTCTIEKLMGSLYCRCNEKRNFNSGSQSVGWKGVGEINGAFLAMIRWRATTKGLEFNLDLEYLWKLFLRQDKKCVYSGLLLTFCPQRQRQTGYEETASLDRIDSSLGYIVGNVQFVHKYINYIKNKFEEGYFLQTVQEIINTHGV